MTLADILNSIKMSDLDLAVYLRVSRPTITGWRSGKSTPHPLMEKGIIEDLKKKGLI